MASSISALTAGGGGVVTSADASGNLNLQSGTTTILALTSTGVAITGTLSATGVTTGAAGSAALPAITTTGDTDTGVWFPAANTLAASTAGVEAMRIDSSGNLLVGTTSASLLPKFQISGNTTTVNPLVLQNTGTTYGTNQYLAFFANSTGGTAGSIQHTAVTTVAYATTSDSRLKENIVDADTVLDKISAVKVRAFDWKEDKLHSEYGFIAQELYKVFPDAVGKGDDADYLTNHKGTWQVEYGRLTPMLLKAIQELKAIIDTQQTQITALNAKVGI